MKIKLYPMFLYPLIALYLIEVVSETYTAEGMKFVIIQMWRKSDFFLANWGKVRRVKEDDGRTPHLSYVQQNWSLSFCIILVVLVKLVFCARALPLRTYLATYDVTVPLSLEFFKKYLNRHYKYRYFFTSVIQIRLPTYILVSKSVIFFKINLKRIPLANVVRTQIVWAHVSSKLPENSN